MKRLLAILLLAFVALGGFGLSAGDAGAGPAACGPGVASILDEVDSPVVPVARSEAPSAKERSSQADGPQYACNSSCARACAQRFGRCPTRQCREAYRACVRGCGC
jgi:hypothetical protein